MAATASVMVAGVSSLGTSTGLVSSAIVDWGVSGLVVGKVGYL